MLWWTLLAPPLATLRSAEATRRTLDAQWASMQDLQAQAQALRAKPPLSRQAALQALQATVQQDLGSSAELVVAGDAVTVTLKQVRPEALTLWLAHARADARSTPVQARLVRSAPTAAPAQAATSWSGTIQMKLPAP